MDIVAPDRILIPVYQNHIFYKYCSVWVGFQIWKLHLRRDFFILLFLSFQLWRIFNGVHVGYMYNNIQGVHAKQYTMRYTHNNTHGVHVQYYTCGTYTAVYMGYMYSKIYGIHVQQYTMGNMYHNI